MAHCGSMNNKNSTNTNIAKAGKRVVGRPFQKGQSGNPSGRPKSRPYIDELKKFLNEGDGSRLRELFEYLLKHKPEIVLYYMVGKPVERHEQSSVVAGLP